jgi:hypothetical protein
MAGRCCNQPPGRPVDAAACWPPLGSGATASAKAISADKPNLPPNSLVRDAVAKGRRVLIAACSRRPASAEQIAKKL